MTRSDPPIPAEVREEFLRLTAQALESLASGRIEVSRQTQSMAPLFVGGERLAWSRLERAPRRGDLLLYLQRPGPIVHRLLGRARDGAWRTKGDNRPTRDVATVPDRDVLGRIVAFERDGAVWSLEGPGPRGYAFAAALLSSAGDLGCRAAGLGDALLRRALFFLGERARGEFLRRPAWWVQRLSQRVLHGLLFGACHPRLPRLPFPETADD
ncbi:MAG: S24/S26 family peptidase [Acidobacteria bacterium]|jgi:hypothetical protein|nr:S24/S26 family peptidase [Acidobacteriota bacterium]